MLQPSPTLFSVKVNKRPLGVYQHIVDEMNYVTATAPYVTFLTEVPVGGNPLYPIVVDGYNIVPANPTANNECMVDYSNGMISFNDNSIHANESIKVSYYGTGSAIIASHVNALQTAVNNLENSVEKITAGDGAINPKSIIVDENAVIGGNLTVVGSVIEELKVKDNIVTLNYGATAGMDAGIEINRGTGNPLPTFEWSEATSAWKIIGLDYSTPYATFSQTALTSNTNIVPGLTLLTIGTSSARFNKIYIDGSIDFSTGLTIYKNNSVVLKTDETGRLEVTDMFNLAQLAGDPTPSTTDIGCIYYDSLTNQFKGIKDAGGGTPAIVILG
jgi:hypothetical protein